MERIVLNHIQVENTLVKYEFYASAGIQSFFTTPILFIQFEEDLADVPQSILSIPFVNIMAGVSWLSNSLLIVEEIDKTYFDSFKRLQAAYGELHHIKMRGRLVPSQTVDNSLNAERKSSILLFGGGVDCHVSFLRNQDRVTHLVNIYGWLNNPVDVNTVDSFDAKNTSTFARKMGVKAVHVRSNFASLFKQPRTDQKLCRPRIKTSLWYGFLHPMAFLSIASVLAWKYQVSELVIASSYTKDRVDSRCASSISTDSQFSFANNGHTIHDGFELNRQDKVRLLTQYQYPDHSSLYLQSCSFNDHNCCKCEKCFRTIVELIAENADPREYGFTDIQGSLKTHWERIVQQDVAMWGVDREFYFYNNFSVLRMKENYNSLNQERKEFADWSLSFDFKREKRKGLFRYYRKNFFSILRRKLHL